MDVKRLLAVKNGLRRIVAISPDSTYRHPSDAQGCVPAGHTPPKKFNSRLVAPTGWEVQVTPSWSKRWSKLSAEKFPKIMAYLNNPVSQRVRTNNHVERTNRMIRFLEKVRYKWRRRKTLVRFVVLRLDDIWSHWVPTRPRKTKSAKALQRRKRQAPTGQQSRQVA